MDLKQAYIITQNTAEAQPTAQESVDVCGFSSSVHFLILLNHFVMKFTKNLGGEMKKNLLTLLFILAGLVVGTPIVKGEVRHSSVSANNFSNRSVLANVDKMERIKSIIKKGEAMRGQMCMDCLDDLEYLEGVADSTTAACGGPNGDNYGSASCQSWLSYAEAVGNAFMANGCGWMLPEGTVTAKNVNRKIQMISKKAAEIS